MTKVVKARMTCAQIETQQPIPDGEILSKTVRLHPVYSDDPDNPNYSYSKATPAGLVQLTITNPGAYDSFDAGASYDIYIVPQGTAVSFGSSGGNAPSPDGDPLLKDDHPQRVKRQGSHSE